MILLITFCVLLCEYVSHALHCHIGGLNVNDIELRSNEYVSCDSYIEKCCNTGCCSKDSKKFLLSFLLLGSGLFIALVYCCLQRCRNKYFDDTRTSPRLSRFTRRFSRSQPTPTPLVVASTDPNLQNPITMITLPSRVPSAPPPMTPPPSYEIAMLSSNAPLDAINRIPSYEDVTKGLEKT